MATNFNVSAPVSAVGTSRAVTIPAGNVLTLIAIVGTAGVGKLRVFGTVGGGNPLTDLAVLFAGHEPDATDATVGGFVTKLTGTNSDFATIGRPLISTSTTTPHTTASGQTYEYELDLEGTVARVAFYAKSSAGCTHTIDVGAVSVDVN